MPKVETKRHIEAFDEYYAMGKDRNLVAVARQCSAGERTVARWSKDFNWQGRVAQRDLENGKKIMAKTDETVVNTKADYRRDIRLVLQPIKAAINEVIVKDPKTGELGVNLIVDDARQLAALVGALDRMVKLDMLLMGEADSRTDNTFKLYDVDLSGYPKPFDVVIETEEEEE